MLLSGLAGPQTFTSGNTIRMWSRSLSSKLSCSHCIGGGGGGGGGGDGGISDIAVASNDSQSSSFYVVVSDITHYRSHSKQLYLGWPACPIGLYRLMLLLLLFSLLLLLFSSGPKRAGCIAPSPRYVKYPQSHAVEIEAANAPDSNKKE